MSGPNARQWNLAANMFKSFSSHIGDLEHWAQPATPCSAHKRTTVRQPTYLSLANVGASSIAISADLTKTGVLLSEILQHVGREIWMGAYRHPGLFKILTTCLTVSSITFGGVMSIYFEAPLRYIEFRRTCVNHLCYTDDDRNGQSESGGEMLFGHSNKASIGSHYKDDTRWRP